MNKQPIRFYTFPYSGHCHRVLWLMNLLGLSYEAIDLNLGAGEQKKPEFLAKNAFGQVPVIQDGELVIADSNAILLYLATQYGAEHWLPKSAITSADLQRWLAVAAGLVAYGPAQARAIQLFGRPDNLETAQSRSHGLFAVMETHLASRKFLLGDAMSLADIANYAYIARAPEGGVSLQAYPNLRAWLSRLESSQGFVAMPFFPAASAA